MTKTHCLPFRPTALVHALAAAGLLAALPVAAQQGPSTRPEEDQTQRVVVTANKRVEKQREVAGTVSVLDGSDLERRGARDQEPVAGLLASRAHLRRCRTRVGNRSTGRHRSQAIRGPDGVVRELIGRPVGKRWPRSR